MARSMSTRRSSPRRCRSTRCKYVRERDVDKREEMGRGEWTIRAAAGRGRWAAARDTGENTKRVCGVARERESCVTRTPASHTPCFGTILCYTNTLSPTHKTSIVDKRRSACRAETRGARGESCEFSPRSSDGHADRSVAATPTAATGSDGHALLRVRRGMVGIHELLR